MGEVYRATDTTLGRTVAIKMLAERHSRDPDERARFTREALAAARLSGEPHVVTVFDVGEHAGRPFIVMEYLEGGTVHEKLRAGPVPPEQALEWLRQAAAALDAAHRSGVVHRDVKPANLLLDRDGVVRVSDFGIASAAGMDTLTLPGTVLGTAGYLSPEQARGEQATPASDRYALAVVAFELLTGRRPFQADTPVTEAFAHLNALVPSAEQIAPSLPPGVDAVFARALAKDPRARPASAGELVEELAAAFEPAPEPTRALPPYAPIRAHRYSQRRRNVAYGAAAASLALAGIAAAALVGLGGDGSGTQERSRTAVRPTSSTTTTAREAPPTTTTQPPTTTTQPPTTTTQPPTTTRPDASSGAALNEEGYARMQAGDFGAALPLLERAVRALRGSGTLAEAYASYNLAYTRFALGRCDGVLALLARSERVQGERREIDALRARAEDACAGGGDEGEGRGKGKGNGRKKND